MKRPCSLLLLCASVAAACCLAAQPVQEDEASSAGAFTVQRFDREAYLQPVPGLDRNQLFAFQRGRRHFDKGWAAVSSLDFEWGLGPTFIAKSCAECHTLGGRGHPPAKPDEQLVSMLVRLSIPGESEFGGPKPHPNYGDQIQNFGLNGPFPDYAYHTAPVPPEAELYLEWESEAAQAEAAHREARVRSPRRRHDDLAAHRAAGAGPGPARGGA
jgi:CxxC motif-containing protein (DUF1111 family)